MRGIFGPSVSSLSAKQHAKASTATEGTAAAEALFLGRRPTIFLWPYVHRTEHMEISARLSNQAVGTEYIRHPVPRH